MNETDWLWTGCSAKTSAATKPVSQSLRSSEQIHSTARLTPTWMMTFVRWYPSGRKPQR